MDTNLACFEIFELTVIRILFDPRFQFVEVGKKSTTYAIVPFFFSPPSNESFKFLKNCQFAFHKILNNLSTPKCAPVCKITFKYDPDIKKHCKTAYFGLFQFSQNLSIGCKRIYKQSLYTMKGLIKCTFTKMLLLGLESGRKRAKPTTLLQLCFPIWKVSKGGKGAIQ